MKKQIYTGVLILLTAAACSKEIDLDLPAYSSKLVVNGELNTDNIISLQVSRSMPILQANDSNGYLIKDAVVTVRENGIPIGTATYFNNRYELNTKPKAGATYTVDVASGKFTPVNASIKIPNQIQMNVSYIDSVGLDADGFKEGRLTLNFKDDASVNNYYKLLIVYFSATNEKFAFELISNDILFVNNEKLNDGGYQFSDRTFSGKTKTLSFPVAFGLAVGTPKFIVSLKCFDEDYNDYLRATEDYSQTGDDAFSNEPVILKTNVNNGLGMIGGVSNARDSIF